MHHNTDRIAPTPVFVTPGVEHWLEREIIQIEHHEGSIRRLICLLVFCFFVWLLGCLFVYFCCFCLVVLVCLFFVCFFVCLFVVLIYVYNRNNH